MYKIGSLNVLIFMPLWKTDTNTEFEAFCTESGTKQVILVDDSTIEVIELS